MKRYRYLDISTFALWNTAEDEECDAEDLWNFHITLKHCGLFDGRGAKTKKNILNYLFNLS
jgi:hypothetical protein